MNYPQFRFELEGMRQTLITHIGKFNAEIEQMVDDETKRVVENFDFEACIRTGLEIALRDCIQEEMKSYFAYGPGRDTVRAEVARLLGKEES